MTAGGAPVPAGNVYDKAGTRNPVARWLLRGFERSMFELLSAAEGVTSILEVGCGEGNVTAELATRFPRARVVGSDLSPEIVAEARRRHPDLEFRTESIYDLDGHAERFDLVVACEVLEHVDDPERALRQLARSARRYVFASVPREPLWRVLNLARGQYVRSLGNTPGHVQHWSGRGFRRFLDRELEILAYRSPLPWSQALGRPRGDARARG